MMSLVMLPDVAPEVSPAPEALSPVSFADMLELLLDLAGGTPLGPAHEVADRDIRRNFDEHMHVIICT